MDESAATTNQIPGAATRPLRLGWLAVLGLVLVLAGMPAYMALIDVPLMRSTGLPTFALAALGVIAGGVAAWRDRRRWVRIIAGANFALLALFVAAFFWLGALPAATTADSLSVAPVNVFEFLVIDLFWKPLENQFPPVERHHTIGIPVDKIQEVKTA